MNTIVVAVFVAFLGTAIAVPLNEYERALSKDEAIAKAKGIKQCILDNKDKPDANEQIPKCILGVFSSEVEVAKQKLETYMKAAGQEVTDFFMNAGKEVRGYYETAKAKALGYVQVAVNQLGELKNKVFGWVEKTIG